MSDPVQDQWTSTGSSLYTICGAVQTFVASNTYTMTELRLRLARGSTYLATTVTINLYTADGSHDPDVLIGNIGSVNTSTLSTSFATVFFTGLSFALTATVEYAIVINPTGDYVCISGDTTENNAVRVEGASGYSNGYGRSKTCAFTGNWACSLNWSEAGRDWYFRVYGTTGRTVSLSSPTDEDTGITLQPLLQWSISGGAVEGDLLDIYLRKDDANFIGDDQLGFLVDATLNSSWQIVGGLEYNSTYYWQVQAFASEASDLISSDVWSFTTTTFRPPAVPTGGEGGDEPIGINNMLTRKRFIAAANNKIWYEDI